MKPKEKAIAYFMNNIEGYDIIKNNCVIGETVDVALEEQAKQIFEDIGWYYKRMIKNELTVYQYRRKINEIRNKWLK